MLIKLNTHYKNRDVNVITILANCKVIGENGLRCYKHTSDTALAVSRRGKYITLHT